MAIVKKISELTPKGSNLGTTDLLIVGVDNGTDYDLKSVTGAQLLGTVVSQTITNGVTSKAPSEDVVYDNLALKVDKVAGSRLITSAESTLLGNTSGTNTGDETVTTIKTKLGITTLSGSNTGDQDLSTLVVKNTAITGATKTKITYDSKGLVTSGADATTADIADSLNKRYVTDANLTVIGNTSGTNTGDETVTTIKTKLGITTLSGSNTGDQIISDATITTTDITTNNFTTAKHGFVPKGTNVGNFLKDDGTWGTPASGGSGVCGIANASGVYTYYATLSLAITAATSGQTVDLLTDITETGSVTLSMKAGVKINGNGYTYTLSVNDDTSLMANGTSLAIELFNVKFVRTGRANNLGGRVFFKNDDTTLVTLRCQNVLFENTYGVAIFANFTEIYGLNIKSYGSCVLGDSGIYNCNLISSTGLGIENTTSGREVVNCNVTSSGTAIKMTYGNVYDSIGRCSSGVGIYAFRVVNSMGISTSDTGIATTTSLAGHSGYNCVGISTSGVGLNGTFTNSTGISTSGYGGTNGTKTNCTLISSSNYASFQEILNNCYLESTTNVPLWLSTGKLVNGCTVICLWNNAGGHAINTTSSATGVDIRNSSLTVTNASAYCINGASASTFKYANNSFKGSTTAVNATNITQGITNLSDTKGNILI